MSELIDALNANWEGYDELRAKAQAVPKYGNDIDYVDSIAKELADYYYHDVTSYKDYYGHTFTTAFMGISNYLLTGKVLGATPDGRKATEPITEGVSPYTGSDTSSCLAALRSSAKMGHDIHAGGTLLNLRLNHDLVATPRGRANLGSYGDADAIIAEAEKHQMFYQASGGGITFSGGEATSQLELLPYHKFGFGKYEALGMPLPTEEFVTPSKDRMEQFKAILDEIGIERADYR